MTKILVVDGRRVSRELQASVLRGAGFHVLEAQDGVEALEVLRRERPSLLISDVLVPTMDGIQLAAAVHADPDVAATPIMFYTASHRLDEARRLAAECGVRAVLGKPAESRVFLTAVRNELAAVAPAAAAILSQGAVGQPAPAAMPPYIGNLIRLQQRLQRALGEGMQLLADAGPLQRSSDRMMRAQSTVHGLSLRFAAALEFGLELAREHDPEHLLDEFCRAGQNLIDARYAGVCMDLNSRREWRFACAGIDADSAAEVQEALDPHAGMLGQVVAEQRSKRIDRELHPTQLGLPSAHPELRNLLLVPVFSGRGVNGWFYLGNKLGAGGFGKDDEQFAVTLAAQLSPTYDNVMLLQELRENAARLQSEIAERKSATDQLAESEYRFRQLAENINEVFFLVAPATRRLLYLSPAYQRIWGQPPELLYERLESWIDSVHRADRARAERELVLAEPPGHFDTELRILRPDGAVRWIRVRGFPILDDAGELQRIAGVAEDVTERHEQAQRIARLTRIHAVLSGTNSAILRIRDGAELLRETCRIAVDEGAFRMAWVGEIAADGQGRVVAAHGIDAAKLGAFARSVGREDDRDPVGLAFRQGRPVACNDMAVDPDWKAHTGGLGDCCSMAAFPLTVESRVVSVLVLCASECGFFDDQELHLLRDLAGDIGFGLQYISKEEQLHYLAYFDPLTGLANDTLFIDRLTQLLNTAKQLEHRVAVLVLDLERFTRINDTFGRQAGDAVLRQVAARLSESVAEPFNLARISADSFAMAIGCLAVGDSLVQQVHEPVLASLEAPFAVDGSDVQVSARIGVAIYPNDGDDASTLFRNAEAALKQAQQVGERILYYAPRMNAALAEKLALEGRLRQAFERGQFHLHYQPRLGAENNEIVGLEALARWEDPERGLIQPSEFIPLLEETGMILELGEWALRQALRDHRQWQDAGLQPPRVAVNVSALQLHRADFVDRVLAAIADAESTPGALELEITESLLMQDVETSTQSLRRLREAGVSISIDDFGTGYSSLSYLARLPLDALKIDRSFVMTMLHDASSMAIVSMVISLVHALKLGVIAEGVDDRAQMRALRRMGCNEMQGYLFSRPVVAERAGQLLARQVPPPGRGPAASPSISGG